MTNKHLGNAEDVTPTISVIVPTLNEVENIDDILRSVLAQRSANLEIEVLVADGGSTDGTQDRVRDWHTRASVRLSTGAGTKGLAGDVLEAASIAVSPIIVVMDADLSHDPAAISSLVAPILDGRADMVIGSRYVTGGSTPGWPRSRRLLSRLGGALAWPLTNVRDPMSGFFAVRGSFMKAVDPNAAGFKIALEIVAAGCDDIRVKEVPIAFVDRVRGTSKISALQVLAYSKRLVALFGGTLSLGSTAKFASVGAAGFLLDLLLFETLYAFGVGVTAAHASSFVIVTGFNYLLNSRWSFRDRGNGSSAHYLRFLTVCLLALFLRGGVIAGAIKSWGVDPQFAIVFGVLAAAIVNYAGIVFYVFPSGVASVTRSVQMRVSAIGVALYVVALRVAFMGTLNLLPEEAYYWNYAQHLDYGYLDHPPVVAWLIAAGDEIAGKSEFAVRMMAPVAWLIATYFSFCLTRNMYGRNAAIVSILLMSALPYFFSVGLLMTPDTPLVAAWSVALYSIERALRGGHKWAWLAFGAAFGIGVISKYTIVLLGPAILVYLVAVPVARNWLARPWPYLGAAIALLVTAPIIVWNAQHEWASFAFQGTRRLEGDGKFSLHVLVASAAAHLTPIGLLAAAGTLLPILNGKDSQRRTLADQRWIFTVVFTCVPLSVFVAFSLFHEVKLNWTGPLWLALLPSLAHQIVVKNEVQTWVSPTLHKLWLPTLAVSLLVNGALLNIAVQSLPGAQAISLVDMRSLPSAWATLGDEVKRLAQILEEKHGQPPVLVGMDKYFLASELAFYADDTQGDNTTGRSLFGADSLMYGVWSKPSDFVSRNMLLVGFKANQISDSRLVRHFLELGPVQEGLLYHGKKMVARFYYREGLGYTAKADLAAFP